MSQPFVESIIRQQLDLMQDHLSLLEEYGIDPKESTLPLNTTLPDSTGYSAGLNRVQSTEKKENRLAETTVPLRLEGDKPPLFAIHGGDGGIFFYANLVNELEAERPVYAFEAAELTSGEDIPEFSVEELATRYIEEIHKIQPHGPYHLCGFCFGGIVAYEMAVRLSQAGEKVDFVGLIEAENPHAKVKKRTPKERAKYVWSLGADKKGVVSNMMNLSKRIGIGLGYRLRFDIENRLAKSLPTSKKIGAIRKAQYRHVCLRAWDAYVPPEYDGDLTLFKATECNDKYEFDEYYQWGPVVRGKIEAVVVPGNHMTLFKDRNINGIAAAFRKTLGTL